MNNINNLVQDAGTIQVELKEDTSDPKSSERNTVTRQQEDNEDISNEDDDTEQWSKCHFSPPSQGPKPVIFMSFGRSGSSVTWDTLSRLTGFPSIAYEYTGGNKNNTAKFFESIPPNVGKDGSWASIRLCKIQQRRMKRYHEELKERQDNGSDDEIGSSTVPAYVGGVVGFQWKPYKASLQHPYSMNAFRHISSYNYAFYNNISSSENTNDNQQYEPPIRVIFLTRNPIDRIISNTRHKGHIHTNEVPAHCAKGDEECISKHQEHSKEINLIVGKELKSSIQRSLTSYEFVKDTLAFYGIRHVTVAYEKLYPDTSNFNHGKNGDNAGYDVKEWKKLLEFVDHPMPDLTYSQVEDTFAMASTSSKRHKDTIKNYDEVFKTLKGTKYQYLLH